MNDECLTSNCELDTHADTCTFGRNVYVLSQDLSNQATVTGFLSRLGEVTAPIVNVAVAYDDADTYTTYVLIFNQVLYFEDLDHHLLSPFQIRMNDVIIKDTPLLCLN